VIEEGGLARSKKTGQYRHGDEWRLLSNSRHCLFYSLLMMKKKKDIE
jgi:hypothetical protein